MRTFLRSGVVITVAILLAGCDENAKRLAKEAQAVVNDYRKELDRQAGVERTAYKEQAGVQAEASREQAFAELEQERIERARNLSAQALEGKWSVSEWRSALREYAEVDVKVHRDMLTGEAQTETALASRLAVLQLSKDKLDALSKTLQDLSENPKLSDQAKSLATFGKSVTTEFDKDVCSSLKSQLNDQTSASNTADLSAKALTASRAPRAKIDEATAAKKRADTALTQIKSKRANKNCDSIEKAS